MPRTKGPQKAAKVISQLDALTSKREMTIVRLSEPIVSAVEQSEASGAGNINNNNNNNNVRTSDISTSSLDVPTPASLEADLEHYKELFAKLRFSYVEQITKEKFIHAIVGDPPLIVDPAENAELEATNAVVKARLKALKRDVSVITADLEKQAAGLAKRHGRVELEKARLRELPARIAVLERAVEALKAQQQRDQEEGRGGDGTDHHPEMRLPLGRTAALVDARRAEGRELDRELERLFASALRKRKEMERLQAELQPLAVKRQNSTAAAREARRRRKEKEAALGGGGGDDDLEERGRWWRTSETVLKQMLDIQG